MPRPTVPSSRAARRRAAREAVAVPLDSAGLRRRVETARLAGPAGRTARARRLLLAWLDAGVARGLTAPAAAAALASGAAAEQIGGIVQAETMRSPPPEVSHAACARGCAFCCILDGPDGGTITENEARRMHAALAPLAGRPDGRAWHPAACPALDPDSRTCRAYDARPSLCRSFFSSDAEACRVNAEGGAVAGAGLLGAHFDQLDAAALARAALGGPARVRSYALSKLAAAAVEGRDLDASLSAARQSPGALDAARRGLAAAAGAATANG